MRNNKGFSLVELIVVIAIMAILAAVAIPTFATFIGRAQTASDADFMSQVESAVELAYAQKGYSVDSIAVTYNNDNDKNPTQVVVTFNEKGANDQAITATITSSSNSGEAGDAAAVIDWNYKFNKTDYTSSSEGWNSNWTLTKAQ